MTQTGLNAMNQITPTGTLTYRQIGTWQDGTPRFEATTALTAPEQRLLETGQQAEQRLADIGVAQIGRVGDSLSRPVNLTNEATEARLMELGRMRLDPAFAERRSALEAQLANQGLARGTEAWSREMMRLDQSQNDAMNQLLLTGRAQAVQEALTERNQPLNEISALMSGTQVGMPQFQQTPQTQVAPTDTITPTMAQYQGQLNAYNQQMQARNATMGALFGLGGAALGGWLRSDARVKRDARRVGTTDAGLPVYVFRYADDPAGTFHMGVMAQDVERLIPDAVAEFGGVKHVRYEELV